MLVMPFLGKAQFSYLGAGVGFRTTTFYKPELVFGDKTKHVPVTLEVNGMYRPLRFLGLGATIGFPIYESSRFSLDDAKMDNDYSFKGFAGSEYGSNANPEFIPKEFGYSYEQSIAFTLKARLYALPKVGGYFDFRLTRMNLTENFVIKRDSQKPLVQEDYAYTEEIKLIIPGFGMGVQHHLSKNIYFDLSANFDFMTIRNNGFAHPVSYKVSYGKYEFITFQDQISGKHTSFVLHFSLGYIF